MGDQRHEGLALLRHGAHERAPGLPGRRRPARGFKTVLVTEADHPFRKHWWPPGHIVGWGDTFLHEVLHFLAAIAGDGEVAPYGADFEDGYRGARSAMRSSARRGAAVVSRSPIDFLLLIVAVPGDSM